ncbi:hypothetical protein RHSIM_Rhsim04G0193100 [Rhododendron simsii]|uniref:Uncharacterized protein n=1 Tax=Rhododendron simsii TaxID=118357 RepID=A0A834H085_RHOSS|nr:hypothetical protein RHSIM_Rhsim04G0193100 [Rhododendron simsii]
MERHQAMDSSLYRAAMDGDIDVLINSKDNLENKFTPNNNTILHVATQFGYIQCVMEILNICPSMYRKVNSRGDTALHVAAREGHSSVVQALIEYAKALNEEMENGAGTAKDMMRVANEEGDTALHEAVRNHHPVAVQLLTAEDPEFCHPANKAEETPLYLAAERGYVGLLCVILENCDAPVYGGPGGRTALHAAVVHNFEGCTKKLLDWKPALCKQADASGWTPLHYAALFGHVTRAKEILNTDKSVAYIADKDNKKIALHLAASQGHVRVMEELISQCPDCWEMVDGRGQNILHIAAKYKKKRAIKFILEKFSFSGLINQKDSDGNTPLHLLAASGCCQASLIKHPKSDRMAFNKENLTPVDVICRNKNVGALVFTKCIFRCAGGKLGQRDVFSRDKGEMKAREKYNAEEKQSRSYVKRVIEAICCL